MLGMEMMLANMLGMTPEEMRDTVSKGLDVFKSLDERFKAIETKQDKILSMLSRLDLGDESGFVLVKGQANVEEIG